MEAREADLRVCHRALETQRVWLTALAEHDRVCHQEEEEEIRARGQLRRPRR